MREGDRPKESILRLYGREARSAITIDTTKARIACSFSAIVNEVDEMKVPGKLEAAYKESLKKRFEFPDEWFYLEKIDGKMSSGGVRAFEPPDPGRLPDDVLKDRGLFDRLILTLRDLAHARSAITFIEEDVDFEERYPLAGLRKFACYETTLIVSYCRPFSESQGGLPRLSYRKMGIRLSPFTRTLHEELIAKRNKIFAHSDGDHIDHAPPTVMNGVNWQGQSFTTLFPPRFQEGILLDYARVQQASILVSSLSNAVMHQLQAMHIHFVDVLPSMDLDLPRSTE
ncbi:hypothetical protein [Microvirga massiliensis]|uniref:hypothetical protein n=1 Tax=Microvirga massiliensis TaxID=1033741 RepID=UPI0006609E40|nr:hypothetical protein [Microvirga massiliensis]